MSITRVRYRERQRLTAADLRLEQEYRLGMAGRHHLSHHQWGVVRGLRVLRSAAGAFTLTPGIAIDGYGREIFVPEPVALEVDDPDACVTLALYYCEADAQSRRRGDCEDVPAPRIAQRYAWVLAADVRLASEQEQIERARAAGRFVGAPPWPVPIAGVGRGCFPPVKRGQPVRYVDESATHYVRHRASLLRSPHGRAVLQLGLTGQSDVYHLLLSTRGGGSLSRRLGVDRDGTVHVWRRLVIAGATIEAQMMLATGKVLSVSLPAIGGVGARVRFEGFIDPADQLLKASMVLLERGRDRPRIFAASETIPEKGGRLELPLGVWGRAAVALQSAKGRPIGFRSSGLVSRAAMLDAVEEARAPEVPPPAARIVQFAGQGKVAGGRLLLDAPDPPAPPSSTVACGDVDRTRGSETAERAPVIQFRPGADIKAGALSREIHAVTVSKPADTVPRTELRISGGAEDETDASSRFCAGTSAGTAGKWLPALRMDGGRRVEILAVEGAPPGPLLEVDGTTYLPPIGKKDPLLPDLLAMAFINGLRQIGKISPHVTLSVKDEPDEVTRGTDLTYTVHAEWTTSLGVQVKRCIEIITGTSGNGDMVFRNLAEIDLSNPPGGRKKDFPITFKRFTHTASRVRIEIRALVARGNTTSVAVATSTKQIIVAS